MRHVVLVILMIIVVPVSLHSITRNEVVSKAEDEANRTYNSAPSGEALFNNLFHPNYRVGDDCLDSSTVPGWYWYTVPDGNGGLDTIVLTNSWTGAPYCYGGNNMEDNCQILITSGYGVGAHKCHYDYYYPDDINNWAAGIDCSAFVCTCLGLGTDVSTSDLSSHCQKISWDDLQPGDLIIKSGSHVAMFIEWVDQSQGLMTLAEAVNIDKNGDHYDRVVKHCVSKSNYESDYSPYKPNCIAGDPAANVAGFRVEVIGGVVHLRWKTECERDTGCFWIERSLSRDGPWERVTEDIPSKGTSTSGAKYEVVDDGYSGGTVYYRLMEREVGHRVLVDRIEVCRDGQGGERR